MTPTPRTDTPSAGRRVEADHLAAWERTAGAAGHGTEDEMRDVLRGGWSEADDAGWGRSRPSP